MITCLVSWLRRLQFASGFDARLWASPLLIELLNEIFTNKSIGTSDKNVINIYQNYDKGRFIGPNNEQSD